MAQGPSEKLESYLAGRWHRGGGEETELINPVTGSVLGTISARGLNLEAALNFARNQGGPALRALSFAGRAKLISALADVLAANRAHYEAIAIANSGNTRTDAAIDIDGGIGTLKYYARLGSQLGDVHLLVDDKSVRLTKAENYQAVHMLVPRHGVAIHINAFNFPSWGLWEKAAVSLLAGVPCLAKPASATAMLSHAMVRDVVAADVLPAGALSLLCGGVGELLDHLADNDIVAFTGSSETAIRIHTHPNVLAKGVQLNVEADSLNAAILGPDSESGTPVFEAFIKEVAREMTVKAGQKCTAIRRVFVAERHLNDVTEALKARLTRIAIGDPQREDVRMGPVVTRVQQKSVLDGIRRLEGEATVISGGKEAPSLEGIDPSKSCFVAPTLLRLDQPMSAHLVHEIEIFGPVATIIPYKDEEALFSLVERGGGSLVASVFSDDHAFVARVVNALGSRHGRLLAVDSSIVDAHSGHGIVMPQCLHGGPGRAGNGAELGGLSGLRLYHQRLALQSSTEMIARLQAGATSLQ